jgi:hypothetical protein
MVVEVDKYNDSHNVTFVLINNVAVQTKKECLNIALDPCMSPVAGSCSHLLRKSSFIEGSSYFTKLFSVILQECCVAILS